MQFTAKASSDRTDQSRTQTFILTDVRPRPVYFHSTMLWRPELATVTWTRSRVNGGAWSPWTERVSVNGPKVLKNGSDSPTQRHHDTWGRSSAEWAPLVEASRPKED